MPTQTFWNLPTEKRDALVALAVEEFADHDYNTASISRIVARAGIAKGSIYQYFADKRELFLFLIDHATQVMLSAVRDDPPPDPEASFFALLRHQMSATTRVAVAYPLLSRLLRRAYTSPLPFQDEVINRGRAASGDHFQQLIQFGIARGDLAADLDPELAAMVVGAVLAEFGTFLVHRLGLDATQAAIGDARLFDTPEVERIYDDMLRILERGLRA
jgi:TetR/AcrR family transcriptional regulator